MLSKNALIKGDVIDIVGKNVVTVIVSLASLMATYISYKHTHEIGAFVITLLIAAEITILILLQKWIWIACRSIPMMHFTLVFIVSYISSVSSLESYNVLYYALMVTLAIVAVINMLTMNDLHEKESGFEIRFCILLFMLLDLGNTLEGITSMGGGIEIITDFISHVALLGAIMLLYLPAQGFLNIRRIAIATCLYVGLGLGLLTILNTVDKFVTVNQESSILTGLTTSCMAMLITLILCSKNKVHPLIENDEYAYTCQEKLLKAISWNISKSERFNRRKLLENAFDRDFVKEYTGRLYGEMDCLKDIEMIQRRLAEIKIILEELDAADAGWMRSKIENVESKGADLLGKLSIAYDFDTGISDCPIELLRSGCGNGGSENEK